MKNLIKIITLAFFIASPLLASNYEGLSRSVSPYSGGISIGPFFALSEDLQEQAKSQLKLSFTNNVHFSDIASVFADFNYYLPDNNMGVDLGFDIYLIRGPISPFLGFGVGVHHFAKENQKFTDEVGGSVTAHLGMAVDLTNAMQVRIRVPFHVVGNENLDMGVGLDIGINFSSQWSHIKTIKP